MRPILLKGHEGPITKIKYNREGDLLFTCARKDKKPCLWYASGERVGTFNGHEGAVWDCDVNFTSTRLLTGSSDRMAKLWDIQTGQELFSFQHEGSVRCVSWAHGDRMALTCQENNYGANPTIFIYNMARDIEDQKATAVREMVGDETGKIGRALWGPLNNFIISASDDGTIRKWNVETGQEEERHQAHTKAIRDMQFSKDQTMFVTAGTDHTAKLWDSKTLKCLKTYKVDRPLNSASISPLFNHVIVGGGQDAMNVTQTSSKLGHFQVDFYHLVYMDYLGSVKGHFGPVNSCAFNPNGKSYASGSEDGYVRIHNFDKDYFTNKYNGLP